MDLFFAFHKIYKRIETFFNYYFPFILWTISSTTSSVECIDSTEEPLLNQLNSVFIAVDIKLNENCELKTNCRELHSRTSRIIQFAKHYDYKTTEANGFRTFSKLVLKFGKLVLNSTPNDSTLITVSHVIKILNIFLNIF